MWNRSAFSRHLLVNMLIVLAVALMLVPLSVRIDAIARGQGLAACEEALQRGLNEMSRQMFRINDSLSSAAGETYFNRLSIIREERHASDYVVLNNARKYIAAAAAGANYVVDIIVTFRDSGIAITTTHVFDNIRDFSTFNVFEDASMDQFFGWEPALGAAYVPGFTYTNSVQRATEVALCYRVPLRLSSGLSARNTAFLLIGKDRLLSNLLPAPLSLYGSIALANTMGELIYTYSAPSFDAGDRSIELSLTDQYKTLVLTAQLPKRYFDDLLRPVHAFVFFCLTGALIIGVTAAFVAARRQTLPIRRLAARIQKDQPASQHTNEYHQVWKGFEALLKERETIASRLLRQRTALRESMLERLLHTGALPQEQYAAIQEEFDGFPNSFLVGYGCFQDAVMLDDEVAALAAVDRLMSMLSGQALIHMLDKTTFALIMPCPEDAETSQTVLRGVLKQLDEDGMQLTLAISERCNDMQQVNAAFEQARAAYVRGRNATLVQTVNSRGSQMEDTSIKRLLELYRCLMIGNAPAVIAMLQSQLFDYAEPEIDLEQRYYWMRMALLLGRRDAFPEMSLTLPKYDVNTNPGELLGYLTCAAEAICLRVLQEKEAQHQARRDEIIAYVAGAFKDYDFRPSSVSERFGVSESRLTSLFKEWTGTTPALYIQRLRLEYAEQLLTTTQMSVTQVSEMSGFYAFNTFYKAFKREYKVTPSQFRSAQNVPRN